MLKLILATTLISSAALVLWNIGYVYVTGQCVDSSGQKGPSALSLYLLNYYLLCNTAQAGEQAVLNVQYTDYLATARTATLSTLALSTAAAVSQGSYVLQCASQYPVSVRVQGSVTTSTYSLSLRLDAL